MFYTAITLLVCSGLPGHEQPDKEMKAALARVENRLLELKAQNPTVTPMTDDAILKTLPGYRLVSVRFRQYPVAMLAPDPLKSQNLLAVGHGALAELSSLESLALWFRKTARPRPRQKTALRAWITLANELIQDGFYRFEVREDSFTGSPAGSDVELSGMSVVRSGGKGELRVTLGFNNRGALIYEHWSNNIKPGPRPICQATKLLDKDPIVRKMAEQDVLVMGRAVKPYLDDQREKAGPALKKAIDRMWKRIIDEGW